MGKKWLLLGLGGIVLFGFILGTSYAWYHLFSEQVDLTTTLEIQIQDDGKGVVLLDTIPMSDEEGKKTEPYIFEVSNKGNVIGNYKLLLQETPFNEIDDGCTKETLLNRSQLKYQLLLNGIEVSVGSVDQIQNNILDVRSLALSSANHYELRIWLPDSASNTDWQNKHYHYSIAILPFGEEDVK